MRGLLYSLPQKCITSSQQGCMMCSTEHATEAWVSGMQVKSDRPVKGQCWLKENQFNITLSTLSVDISF